MLTIILATVSLWLGAGSSVPATTVSGGAQRYDDLWPAWAPDGRRLVFSSTRDGDPEIYTMNVDATDPRRLTTAAGRDAHPAWSPDGRTIAFQSPRVDGHTRIFLMNADGSNQRPLTSNRGFCGVPSWSPDGKRIAYQCTDDLQRTRAGKPWQLYVVEVGGGEPQPLTRSGANDQVPNWSPDGKHILFYSDRTGLDQLYVINADGGELTPLTRSSTASRVGSWSADGRRILFQSGHDGSPSDVSVMSNRGENVVRLTSAGVAQGIPFFSPDGRTIAFNAMAGDSSRIWLMNADGSNLRMLGAAVVSPGRGGMALVSYSGEDAVGIIDPETRTVVGRIPVAKDPHEIALSRDRSRAYVATTGGAPARRTPGAPNVIAALDLRTQTPLGQFDLGTFESPHDIRVSADGAIVWVACAPAQSVLEIDTRTGRIITVWSTKTDGGWFLAVIPDGSKIYVPHLEGKRVSVIDRPRRAVATVLEGGAQSGIDVSPDGRNVWVIDHERRAVNVIDTSTDRVIARVPLRSGEFGRLRFTPDGTRVVVVQQKSLEIFDTSTRQLIGEMELPFAGKVLDISPSGDRALVSHPADDQISIVDLTARKVVASIRTGKTPDGVAWVH